MNGILAYRLVLRQQCQSMFQGLADQDSIEGVPMQQRKWRKSRNASLVKWK